jgi:WD40 repeat protein
VTGSSDRDVRVWDAATGVPRAPFEGDSAVNALAVSPDGAVVAATTTITARTWEIATGSPGVTISGRHEYLNAVAFDSSGALLGIASTDNTATIWDAATGVPVTTLAGHGSSVTAVAFSPASPYGRAEVATGSLDGTARTWDTATGRPRVTLAGHSSWVNALAYAPSGTMIGTGSGDGTARTCSPSGTLLATASSDATARIWVAASGAHLATLVPLPSGGYITLLPDASYKLDGDPGDCLWWAAGLRRLRPGEAGRRFPEVRRLPPGAPILPRPMR